MGVKFHFLLLTLFHDLLHWTFFTCYQFVLMCFACLFVCWFVYLFLYITIIKQLGIAMNVLQGSCYLLRDEFTLQLPGVAVGLRRTGRVLLDEGNSTMLKLVVTKLSCGVFCPTRNIQRETSWDCHFLNVMGLPNANHVITASNDTRHPWKTALGYDMRFILFFI